MGNTFFRGKNGPLQKMTFALREGGVKNGKIMATFDDETWAMIPLGQAVEERGVKIREEAYETRLSLQGALKD